MRHLINTMRETGRFTEEEITKVTTALKGNKPEFMLAGIVLVVFIVSAFAVSYGYRHYNVWSMEMKGKALLAEATQSRQIQIEQAKAEKEASIFTAEAIAVVGEATKQYPEYRQQIYIQAFAEALSAGTISQIMYIPTEAGIPILEAGKR